MGDHEHEFSELPDRPHHVWEDEPTSTYGTPIAFGRHSTAPSHEYLSRFTYSTHPNRSYWLSGNETHHASTNTSTIRYGMHDIHKTSPAPHD